jgi:hypothetical protein
MTVSQKVITEQPILDVPTTEPVAVEYPGIPKVDVEVKPQPVEKEDEDKRVIGRPGRYLTPEQMSQLMFEREKADIEVGLAERKAKVGTQYVPAYVDPLYRYGISRGRAAVDVLFGRYGRRREAFKDLIAPVRPSPRPYAEPRRAPAMVPAAVPPGLAAPLSRLRSGMPNGVEEAAKPLRERVPSALERAFLGQSEPSLRIGEGTVNGGLSKNIIFNGRRGIGIGQRVMQYQGSLGKSLLLGGNVSGLSLIGAQLRGEGKVKRKMMFG